MAGFIKDLGAPSLTLILEEESRTARGMQSLWQCYCVKTRSTMSC